MFAIDSHDEKNDHEVQNSSDDGRAPEAGDDNPAPNGPEDRVDCYQEKRGGRSYLSVQEENPRLDYSFLIMEGATTRDSSGCTIKSAPTRNQLNLHVTKLEDETASSFHAFA